LKKKPITKKKRKGVQGVDPEVKPQYCKKKKKEKVVSKLGEVNIEGFLCVHFCSAGD
jgi:hypothetical protein